MGFGDKGKKEKAAEKNAASNANVKAAQDDAGWEETDKGAKKKLDRAAAQADKEAEAARKRAEKKELEEAENEAVGKIAESAEAKKNKKQTAGKLTQAQIQQNLALMAMSNSQKKPAKQKKTQTVDAPEVTPNTNRNADLEASNIDSALKQLEIDPSKAPKKMTYKEFEAEMTDKVKEDNPGLKQNQVKDKVWKLWERSPLNPKNAVES